MHLRTRIGIAALLCLPAMASAQFERTEDIFWPEDGRFTGYPAERDTRPVLFSVSGGVYHDDNILRRATDGPSDTIYRIGVGLKADVPVSRQRLLIDASIDNYEFDRNSTLDHTAYNLGAAWRWQVGSDLTGDVGYSRRRYLGDLGEIQAAVKDLVTRDHAYANAGYHLTPRWRVRAGANWRKWDHGDAARSERDLRVTSTTVGLDYVTPATNSIGVQHTYSQGEYPNRQVFPGGTVINDFDEYETSAVLRYVLTGKSTLNARLGYTKREHDQVPARDFDGATGRLSLDWFVAGKTRINGAVWREIRSAEEIGTLEEAAASYIVSTGVSVGPAWAPTSKLVFQALLVHEKRDYEGDPGPAFNAFPIVGTPGVQREDTFNGIRLSAGYTPRRYLRFTLGLERGERDSNVSFRDYEYNRVSANASLQF